MPCTMENCAKLCIKSLSCHSFEYVKGKGRCNMYVATSTQIGIKNKKSPTRLLYDRIIKCGNGRVVEI